MKRVFLLIASAVLLAAEAPAARMSLLDLIGGGSRRSSRSRHAAADKRRAIRVDHDAAAQSSAATNAVTEARANAATNSIAETLLAATNGVEIIAEEETAPAPTNVVEAAAAATNAVERAWPKREGRPARITASRVYYDRKEGYAVFTGRVHVDGEEYQLHAGKAYVFFEGTNELKRVVATDSVAITNETKRAYGAKASYYRKSGMVVLYGNEEAPAEVRDESKGEDQIVKGSKIKFWIDSEQVEVLDARISAPVSGGLSDLKAK